MKKSIDLIIEKLGYNESYQLYYYNDLYTNKKINISLQMKKNIKDIKPYAFYCIDNKPFILFFTNIENAEQREDINKKIWNMQIPVVIYDNLDSIKIFNGSDLDFKEKELFLIQEIRFNDINKEDDFSYWNINTKSFWNKYEKIYKNKKLNELMLENIKYITDKLKKKYNLNFATKLILRVIFIRFLIDKGIDICYDGFSNNIKQSQQRLIDISKDKKELYKLFSYLKEKFNGNLFELNDELSDANLVKDVFILISDFLSGTEVLWTGQKSFFPMYDFDVIPVSLISNIYEILLGKEKQQDDKAFYTPDYLAKFVVKQAIAERKIGQELLILDPACGSGIFLEECFRNILEANLDNDGDISDNDKINRLLCNNIFGVDINKEAIDVTVFSLYLTIMDYKNPKTLQNYKFPNLENNLFVLDFFDERLDEKLLDKKFDLIIGNPPWGALDGKHIEYCKQNNLPILRKEISRSFIFKVKQLCNTNTRCCLVIPSTLLYKKSLPAVKTREILLKETKIEKLIEMSAVRKLIFKNAIAPTSIIIFRKDGNEYIENNIKYISFKPNIFFELFNIIAVEKNDIKFVSQKFLLENDWAWKTILYGTSYDIKIIQDLKRNYNTLEKIIKEKNFIQQTGIAINSKEKEKKDSRHFIGMKILDSNNGIEAFKVDTSNMEIFDKEKIHRVRTKEQFEPPYCLLKKGVDIENYKMRAAYTEEKMLYKDGIDGIKANIEDKEILLNITGLLNSSLYAYLNFMLGSSIGVEREQRFVSEINEFPYIYREKIVKKVNEIQNEKQKYTLINISYQEEMIKNLDEIILEEFGLNNNEFIDYALNIQIPLVNSKRNITMRTVKIDEMKRYASYFEQYFKSIFNKSGKYIKIVLYPNIKGIYSVFELIISDNSADEVINVYNDIEENKELLTRFMINKHTDMFYQIKNVINFEENSFYIIKTNEFKNWHPAMAKIDLAEVIDDMLSGNGGDK